MPFDNVLPSFLFFSFLRLGVVVMALRKRPWLAWQNVIGNFKLDWMRYVMHARFYNSKVDLTKLRPTKVGQRITRFATWAEDQKVLTT